MPDHHRRGTFPQQTRPDPANLRYTTGIPNPVPVFGHRITRSSSRPPVDATRTTDFGSRGWGHTYDNEQNFEEKSHSELEHPNDIFRNANTRFKAPSSSRFRSEARHYHTDGNHALHARRTYWDNMESSGNPGKPYNDPSAQDAEWAADSTRRETESRQRYLEDYIGYEEFISSQGHRERIKRMDARGNELGIMEKHHRDWEKEEENWEGDWYGKNKPMVRRVRQDLLDRRQPDRSRCFPPENRDRSIEARQNEMHRGQRLRSILDREEENWGGDPYEDIEPVSRQVPQRVFDRRRLDESRYLPLENADRSMGPRRNDLHRGQRLHRILDQEGEYWGDEL